MEIKELPNEVSAQIKNLGIKYRESKKQMISQMPKKFYWKFGTRSQIQNISGIHLRAQ